MKTLNVSVDDGGIEILSINVRLGDSNAVAKVITDLMQTFAPIISDVKNNVHEHVNHDAPSAVAATHYMHTEHNNNRALIKTILMRFGINVIDDDLSSFRIESYESDLSKLKSIFRSLQVDCKYKGDSMLAEPEVNDFDQLLLMSSGEDGAKMQAYLRINSLIQMLCIN